MLRPEPGAPGHGGRGQGVPGAPSVPLPLQEVGAQSNSWRGSNPSIDEGEEAKEGPCSRRLSLLPSPPRPLTCQYLVLRHREASPHGTCPELPGADDPRARCRAVPPASLSHCPPPPRTLSTSQWHPPRGPGRLSALHHLQPEGALPCPEPGAGGCESRHLPSPILLGPEDTAGDTRAQGRQMCHRP